LAHKERRKR